MWSRRQFLKAGLAGGATLAVVRALYGPFSAEPSVADDAGFAYGALGPKERTIVAAIAPVVLDGALPDDDVARGAAIVEVVRGVDTTVAGLPLAVQNEVAELFGLLGFPVTRRIVAGVAKPWLDATPADIARFLERWRTSDWALLRSAHRALQELVMAAWYGNPASWPRIGYAGPPVLSK